MDFFNKTLINAVKMFESSSEEDIEDEKIAFLKYCFKNIECKDPDDLVVCNETFERLAAGVDGYFYDEDTESYNLFQTIYDDQNDDESYLDELNYSFALNKVKEIIRMACDDTYDDFDDSSTTYDICVELKEAISREADIIINVYSNFIIPDELKDDGNTYITTRKGKKISVYFKVYDLLDLQEKLEQLSKENIELNCLTKFSSLIPALLISSTNDFDVYMCSMNGSWLARLYKEDGVRLLEPNVRSYLKRTQKTNSGIFETIKVCPENFVTYNNGLAAVATDIEYESSNDRFIKITKLFNFQIVNGGQTTATLAEALKEPAIRGNLADIIVPVKLTVVKNLSNSSRLIGDISVFSNTQTAIKKSDPPSNLPFYISIKKLSNECISNDGGTNYICYFERTTGEYDTELRRNNSTKTFQRMNPSNRKFNKIELANAINAWEQLPFTVCLGKEKSFASFNEQIKNQLQEPDQAFFKKSYAVILLMKYLDKRVKKLGLTYKSNVVAYGLSYLSMITNRRIDLMEIWDLKAVPDHLYELIDSVLDMMHRIIMKTPSNVPEPRMWARKQQCWEMATHLKLSIGNIPLSEEPTTFFVQNEHLLFIQQDENFFNSLIWTKLILWNDKYKILNKSQLSVVNLVKRKCMDDTVALTQKQKKYAIDIFLIAVKNKFNY